MINEEIIKKYNNPIERLIAYQTLTSGLDPISLKELSISTNIPLSVIQKDFEFIFENGLTYIQSEEEIDDASLFTSGEYNNYLFYSDTPYEGEYSEYTISIPVTIEEYISFQNLFEQKIFPKKPESERSFITSTIRNKKYVNDNDPGVLKNLESIEFAISDGSNIKFEYKAPGENKYSTVIIKPTKIGFDATENRYVIISTPDNKIETYELDCIRDDIKPDVSQNITSHPEYLNLADKVWGFEYDKCLLPSGKFAKPIHVKVEFYNHGNVLSKVRRSLEFRTPDRLEVNKKGNLIYEDDIFGKDSFINWILSFGSSAKIIAPKSLANEIVQICQNALNYF